MWRRTRLAMVAVAVVMAIAAVPNGPAPAEPEAGQLQRRAAAAVERQIADPPSNSRLATMDPSGVSESVGSVLRSQASVPSTLSKHRRASVPSTATASKPPAATAGPSPIVVGAIPAPALRAYQNAADIMAAAAPSCHLPWSLLAGIGRVESDHGRFGGNTFDAGGTVHPGIIGPALNGVGVAAISDTDGGRWDGDPVWDHAVGPMQFIPSTWKAVGIDANGDGVADPENIDDAALAAGVYLCAYGTDLSTQAGARTAVFGYNHSAAYVAEVLALAHGYASGNPAVMAGPISSAGDQPNLAAPAPSGGVAGSPARTGPARVQQPSSSPSPNRNQAPRQAARSRTSPTHPQPSSQPAQSATPAIHAPRPSTRPTPKPTPTESASTKPSSTPEPAATAKTTASSDPTPRPSAPTAPTAPAAPAAPAAPTMKPTQTPTTTPTPTSTTPSPSSDPSASPDPSPSSDPSPIGSGSPAATPSHQPTEPAPSPTTSPSPDPVICQAPDLYAGTLQSCTQGDVQLQHYVCLDPQTDWLMRLGAKQDDEPSTPPVCVYASGNGAN